MAWVLIIAFGNAIHARLWEAGSFVAAPLLLLAAVEARLLAAVFGVVFPHVEAIQARILVRLRAAGRVVDSGATTRIRGLQRCGLLCGAVRSVGSFRAPLFDGHARGAGKARRRKPLAADRCLATLCIGASNPIGAHDLGSIRFKRGGVLACEVLASCLAALLVVACAFFAHGVDMVRHELMCAGAPVVVARGLAAF